MSNSAGRGSAGSRRRIREAVVQFLYAADSGSGLPEGGDASVLELLLEPLREKATGARAKAVLHLQQGRAREAATLEELVRNARKIDVTGDESGLVRAIRDLHESEQAVNTELEHLRHELAGNKSDHRLRESLEAAREANIRSRAAAARISACVPVFPALEMIQRDALRVWSALTTHSERLTAALARQPGDIPELRKVAQAEAEVSRVSARIQSYLDGLRQNLAAIDEHLASVVDNYAPERIDRVDRAILRLATYELLFDAGIPSGVAIDEAIELARSFGTTDSPRFVNGVLDKLPKP